MIKNLILSSLLISVACSAMPVAYAQSSLSEQTAPDKNPIKFSANNVQYDSERKVIIADGEVYLEQDGNVLKADKVTYNQETGKVIATGNITIQDTNGHILYMEEAELNGSLEDGFVRNTRLLLSDDSRLIAEEGIRDGKKTTLKYATYSPCKICDDEPGDKPLWQIRAKEINHDQEDRVIRYKDVVLEIAGIPVLYTPYFSHADPSVPAQSGFLGPDLGSSSELGVFARIPYYWRISDHQDFTVEPIISTNEPIAIGGSYRQHTGNGIFNISGSVANATDLDENFQDVGEKEIRGHIFSDGQFELNSLANLGGDWQWDYQFKWVSDDTYLRRYYDDKSDVLESHARLENFTGRSYGALAVYGFQGLDEEDEINLTPFALPALDISIVGDPGKWGNQLSFDVSAASIYRFDGSDTQRISGQAAWKLPIQGPLGDSYTITGYLRGDLYHNNNSAMPDQAQFVGIDGTHSRILPSLAIDWSMPFLKSGENVQQVIEPLVSVIVAPEGKNGPEFSNEDSRNFEFDENNLFTHNRFNGYDLWEGGTRVNYGIRYSLFSDPISIVSTLGQSYRLSESEFFPVGSGFEGNLSDFVGRVDVTFKQYIDLVYRFRLDKDSFAIRRNELIMSGGLDWVKASIRYLDLDRGDTDLTGTELENREEFGSAIRFILDQNWTLHGSFIQDVLNDQTISYDVGLIYKDECLEFGLRFEKRFTSDRDITPSDNVTLRLVLKNLGS